MNIEQMIEKWEEKHSSLLNDYSKGNANNEVMQMYRNQMKNVLDFINDLRQVKNISSNTVLADSKTILHRCSCEEGNPVEVKICLNCDGIFE